MGEKFELRASTRGDDWPKQVATRTIYATIIVNGRILLAEQRLHTDRTNLDVAYFTSDPRVRNGRLYGRKAPMSRREHGLQDPLDQIPDPESRSRDQRKQNQTQKHHDKLELAIPVLVGRR